MGGGGKNRNNFATSRRKKRIFAWSVTTGTEKAVIIHKVIMFATLKIELVNDHIIIVDNGQRILMDTGSPLSFHPTGHLSFGENRFEVLPEIPSVSTQYLSDKVGCEIDGILGMDVINLQPVTISLKDGLLLWDDDAVYPSCFQRYPLSALVGGFLAITVSVNHRRANLIVDTGAFISYIHPDFVSGLTSEGVMDDFSPFVGDFQTETFLCEVDTLGHGTYSQVFGVPPQMISMSLEALNVDGVIGLDLFKRYRLQIKEGNVGVSC